jgi:pimeloyl-ACP methyl ester carboxylesterase
MQIRWRLHPGQGPHLLLVHGFLTGPAQWQPNLNALATVCTPVTVNLWGHAGAPSPNQPDAYHPDHYVAQFDSLRAQLGAARWFLLGYSLGASLTLRYALDHSDRVMGHLFTNSTSALADAGQVQAWKDSAAESAARISAGGQRAMERIPVHPRHARKLPPEIYAALAADADDHDPEGIANTLLYTSPAASVRDRVIENTPPALLICGERERRFRPHREFVAQRMPNLQITSLAAGHGMSMEVPETFNRAVISFVKQWSTSSIS